jgi:signal transduction histidine kinase
MQMRQLFTNLFTNAIKFKKADQPPRIRITCKLLNNEEADARHLRPNLRYYLISVSDQGIGFDQEYAEKIFQIFQRLHGKAEYPGSGIGLAICKKIADNHMGTIYSESVQGKGATFNIILPETQS